MSDFELNPMPEPIEGRLLERLSQAEVATIGHWRRWGFPDRSIRRVTPGRTVVGTAVTVACPSHDNSIVHYALSLLRAGDLLVIDRLGDTEVACYGGVVNLAVRQRGAAGVIIDGPCTDVREIEQSGLSVWCRGVSARTSRACGNAGRLNVPASIGGAVVMPGDALLCDDDGILVLPPGEVAMEADRAVAHQGRVEDIRVALTAGANLPELNGIREKVLAGRDRR